MKDITNAVKSRYVPIFCFSILVLVMTIFAGCASVVSVLPTSRYYTPETSIKFPKKNESAYILKFQPQELKNRKYMIVGNLLFWTKYGWDYIGEAIQFNGRENGADAYMMKSHDEKTESYQYYVRGYTTYDTVTTHHSGGVNANSSYGTYSGSSTATVPTYHPGHTATRMVTRREINVDYIVFLDKDSWGEFGFDMKNIENGGVIIDAIIDESPAQEAGLIPGDILIAIGDMKLNSAEQYDLENKGFVVGKEYEIIIKRGGEQIVLKIKPISYNAIIKLLEKMFQKK